MSCLRVLHTLRRVPVLSSTFSLSLSLPLAKPLLTPGSLHYGGARGECKNLKPLLEKLAEAVQRAAGDVLLECERTFPPCDETDTSITHTLSSPPAENNNEPFSSNSSPDLLSTGVWSVVIECLTSNPTLKSSVFNPGVASVWSSNYRSLTSFLSSLSSSLLRPRGGTPLEISAARRRLLDVAAKSTSYNKLWNLPIYYQLRFAESVSAISLALELTISCGFRHGGRHGAVRQSPSAPSTSVSSLGFVSPLFSELYETVLNLFRKDVMIKGLSARFAKGAITIIRRVLAWTFDGLETGTRIDVGTPTVVSAAHASATAAASDGKLAAVAAVATVATVAAVAAGNTSFCGAGIAGGAGAATVPATAAATTAAVAAATARTAPKRSSRRSALQCTSSPSRATSAGRAESGSNSSPLRISGGADI